MNRFVVTRDEYVEAVYNWSKLMKTAAVGGRGSTVSGELGIMNKPQNVMSKNASQHPCVVERWPCIIRS